MTKTQAKRECVILFWYSIALKYVDDPLFASTCAIQREEIHKQITKLENKYGFDVHVENEKCYDDKPDAVFDPEEWQIVSAPL